MMWSFSKSIPMVVLVIVAMPVGGPAWAWGSDGHAVVCDIAFRELKPAPRSALLDLHRGDSYRTFAESCNWPDHIRGDPDFEWVGPYHYINVPKGAATVKPLRDCPERGCLLSGIADNRAVLRDPSAKKSRRREALRFFGHFIGDLHQPLHVSYAKDWGGNKIKVTIFDINTNLHSTWDSKILREMMRRESVDYPTLTWREFGKKLHREITPAQRTAWRAGQPLDWAKGSLKITQDPETRYRASTNKKTLGKAYFDDNAPKIRDQIKKAGVRLGAALNRLLGQ